ncbi:hypothetical protein [Anaerotignum propionicum]|uniref:hypothetical protein n=1 Tax=Anaerotignum propionicum TaxID=28446 RepID=UPI00289D5F36|nr:hypothetical protein [Anaerotignum propionicum]
MIEKAIAKINAEVQKAPCDAYWAIIGEYIIDHIITEDDAAKVLEEEKTLEKALDTVASKVRALASAGILAAKKRGVKSGAYNDDETMCCWAVDRGTIFCWVMQYFGLQGEDLPNLQTTAERREEKLKEKPVKKGVVLALEDFFS